MAGADYRLMTEATGQRIATALEALGGGKLPLNFATLDALPSTVTTGDVLPVERGTTTYKIDYNALAAAILAGAALAGHDYNGNIDNLRDIGVYYLGGATGTGAGPNNFWGMLVVAGNAIGTRAVQLYIDVWDDSAMFRRYGGTSWSAWKAFTLTA